MTAISFPGIGARLPSLASKTPSDTCPLCDAMRIPPESDDGIPPPHQWNYACGAGHWADDEVRLEGWQAYRPCYRVSTAQALAWLRDGHQDERLSRALTEAVPAAPYDGGALFVALPKLVAASAPSACPCCARPVAADRTGSTQYACGASYGVSSRAPDARGELVATSFIGQSDCERPPLEVVLRTLAEREDAWAPIVRSALRALDGG